MFSREQALRIFLKARPSDFSKARWRAVCRQMLKNGLGDYCSFRVFVKGKYRETVEAKSELRALLWAMTKYREEVEDVIVDIWVNEVH